MPATAVLRCRYLLLVQLGLVLALGLLVAAFTIPFGFEEDVTRIVTPAESFKPVDLPQTEQIRRPPPPPRPPAPIEVDDIDAPDVVIDIDLKSLDGFTPAVSPIRPPEPPKPDPKPEPDEEIIFVIVESPPELIGGLAGLQERITYPDLARRAGIEGTVYVQFVVDEKGNVVDPVCVRDPGGQTTCEEALKAVRTAKFKPGRQRGKAVKVRFSLPVKFRLR